MTHWLATLGMVTALARLAGACTIVTQVVEVASDFRVVLEDRERPAEGVTVMLSRNGEMVTRVVTGRDGIAYFNNVTPGSYDVGPETQLGIGDRRGISVKAKSAVETVLRLKWPSGGVLMTQSLKGRIRLPARTWNERHRPALELVEGRTGRILHQADLTEAGTFDFSSAGPGIYFLILKSGTVARGSAAVEVNARAVSTHMDIDTGWSSCGAHLSDRNACPPVDLHVSSLRGRIADAGGGGISRALIRLMDADGRVVLERSSDEQTNFDAKGLANGMYRLEVHSNPFAVFRAHVRVSGEGTAAPYELRLEMAGSASCGSARTY